MHTTTPYVAALFSKFCPRRAGVHLPNFFLAYVSLMQSSGNILIPAGVILIQKSTPDRAAVLLKSITWCFVEIVSNKTVVFKLHSLIVL